MCGVVGMIGPGADRRLAEAMVESVSHRGPDASGIRQLENGFIGHSRLRIIDLVTGDQPVSNEDGTVWVAFNGEIYNFKELRKDLQSRGRVFRTRGDTETIVHGYEEFGIDFLPRLDGIFAFALWDDRKKRLLLVRDYFGVKPMHYHYDGRTMRFGSEIKSILCDPAAPRKADFQAVHYFMNLRYIPGDRTLFDGIRRLPSAHYLLFENGNVRVDRYYSLTAETDSGKTDDYYEEGIRHYLRRAVKKQLISDVPLGAYLSGGLDSSSIVAFMSESGVDKVKTFSLGFNEPNDELVDARIVAEHFATDHHEMTLNPDPLDHYPKVIWNTEEPKVNILQGYLLARFAKEHVKVVLSGLGGDELFAGYEINRYIRPSLPFHRLTPDCVTKKLLQPVSRLVYDLQSRTGTLSLDEYRRGVQMLLSLGDPERYYLILRNTWDYDKGALDNLYGPVMAQRELQPTHGAFDGFFQDRSRGILDRVLWAEFHTKMVDDFLLSEDRTSMAHGLEVRVPFLDRDLVRFAMSIPVDLKIRRNRTKYIFRKAMAGILPEHALRKKKWGFTVNSYHQFRKDLKAAAESVLTRDRVESRGWFDYAYLRRILDHPPHPRMRWHYFVLWLVLGLEIWARMFLDGDPARPDLRLESHYG